MTFDFAALGGPLKKGTVVAVVGPTASGKTALSVALAKALDGEIISGDSMQIYRGMDIGTAKVTRAEAAGVPHHLIDIREPGEAFNAADYQKLARAEIRRLLQAGRLPVLVGGTGLYIDAALYNYDFSPEAGGAQDPASRQIRAQLADEAARKGTAFLWEKLRRLDPASADKIHINDQKRLIRALEYLQLKGRPFSENNQALVRPRLIYPTRLLGLKTEREALYRRIDSRVEEMLARGLEGEARALYDGGLALDSQAAQAIGYRQFFAYFGGQISREEAIRRIRQESRHYAKRQLTWFGRNPHICWIDSSMAGDAGFLAQLIASWQPGPQGP